ncbi:DMT family transporter [Thalassovita sp.]|uniref:DMT family transporter n=1 Tax=Thalassovita sp. TaxID=1979401 RepID=UPI0029DE8182|nr:DMT family transporter [Thalassovita sp.]
MTPIQKSIPPRAWVELLLLSLIWGGSFLSVAVIIREIPVLWAVAWRVGGAAAVLWAYVLWRGLAPPRGWRAWGAFLGMGLLNNVIPFTLITWGQQHISTGLAGILNALTAVLGVLVAALLLADERLTTRKGVGVLLGFAGAATVIGPAALGQLNPASLGQLALLGSSLSYALAGVWARRTLAGQTPQVAAAGMLTASTLMMVPLAWITEGAPALPQLGQTWVALAYLSLIATAGAYLLYYRVLGMAGSGNLMLVTLMIAPFAVLLGALVLGETLPPRAYGGFALLAAGLIVIDGRLARVIRNRV